MATYAGVDLTDFETNLDALYYDPNYLYNNLIGSVYNLTGGGGTIKTYEQWKILDPATQATYDKVYFELDRTLATPTLRLIYHEY